MGLFEVYQGEFCLTSPTGKIHRSELREALVKRVHSAALRMPWVLRACCLVHCRVFVQRN